MYKLLILNCLFLMLKCFCCFSEWESSHPLMMKQGTYLLYKCVTGLYEDLWPEAVRNLFARKVVSFIVESLHRSCDCQWVSSFCLWITSKTRLSRMSLSEWCQIFVCIRRKLFYVCIIHTILWDGFCILYIKMFVFI